MSDDRPNILLLVSDQQRYDTLGCNGNRLIRTPHLDRLAEQGMRFTRAYTVCATCSPARASMLTGLYPHNHGMLNNQNCNQVFQRNLPEDVRLVSQDLIEAGYQCAYSGKWHVGTEKLPSHYGFEGMDVPGYGNPYEIPEYEAYLQANGLVRPGRRDAFGHYDGGQPLAGVLDGPVEASAPYFLADYTIDLLRRQAAAGQRTGQPFMIFSSFWAPHWPVFVPEPYASMIDPDDVPLPASFHDTFEGRTRMAERMSRCWPVTDVQDEHDWRRLIARYWEFCMLLDDQVGRILSALDELALADDTLVLFTTDHGDMQGAHGGMYDKGMFMFEETYHIPMLARWPGVTPPGAICDAFVSNMDVASTALDAPGVPVPDAHDGHSLAPLLRDSDADWADDVYCQFTGYRVLATMRMVRWSHYKYVFNAHDYDEFYDLAADPNELHNVVSDPAHRAAAQEGRQRLIRHADASGEAISWPIRQMLTHGTDRPDARW
jgi:arylsulfatase A-like enzyme